MYYLSVKLNNMINQAGKTLGNEHPVDVEAYFGLSEEVFKPVNLNVENQDAEVGNYLQKLHIKNHSLASKEVVHDLYADAAEFTDVDHQMMSDEDELLFEEIQNAVTEKEITDLRANLQSIAQSITIHNHTIEEIEELLSGELDEETQSLILHEASMNGALAYEIELHGEINSAIGESDIMSLRNGLKALMKNQYSHSRSVSEIDSYMNGEMDELSLSEFEGELLINSGLSADLLFHGEVDHAIAESEIMSLRDSLKHISKEVKDQKADMLGISSPKRKNLIWYAVASSIVLIIAFSSLLKQRSVSSQQLYSAYYQPYRNGLNVSRSSTRSNSLINSALSEMDKRNFTVALRLLNDPSAMKTDGFSANFYSGVAYQELGDYRSAIKSFTKVVNHADNLLVEQSEWYIGLCYLKTEEREKAVRQFSSIVSKNGYYREPSKKILKQFD